MIGATHLRNDPVFPRLTILRDQIKGRIHLSDTERQTLAEIGKQLGKQALEEVATIVKPDTILGWHRKLAAETFDGSNQRRFPGRPRVDKELEDWVVKMAQENRSWGYDRIAGALAELGYDISDQTVGNMLKRRGIPPALAEASSEGTIECRERLGGLLKYYHRKAA